MAYVDWDLVAGDGTIPSASDKAIIEQQVGVFLIATFGQDFLEHSVLVSDSELHTIGVNQNFIIAKNFPIISIQKLKDNIVNNISPTELTEGENFTVRKCSGLITLIQPIDGINNLENFGDRFYFTQGVNSVSLAYTYGFVTLPTDIQGLVNISASFLYKAIKKSSSSGDFTEIEMGDFRKKVGQGKITDSVSLYENGLINTMIPMLRSKYGNFVSLGTQAED